MSGNRSSDWPPIISRARPRWILWRDIIITLSMWGIFLLIVEAEFTIIWHKFPTLAGTSAYNSLGFGSIREELRPAVALIILLVSVLGVSTLFSSRRRANSLLQPQPSQVADDDLARDLGLSSGQLEDLRIQQIIILDTDAQGSATIILGGSAGTD